MCLNPPGIEFRDTISQREMKLVTDGSWKGWIVYKHPDGQWVTFRRATIEDHERLAEAICPTASYTESPVFVIRGAPTVTETQSN